MIAEVEWRCTACDFEIFDMQATNPEEQSR